MTTLVPRYLRRGSVLLLIVASTCLNGCTGAVLDAASAGALNFIESGVMSTLSSMILGEDAASMEAGSQGTAMDEMVEGHGE